MLCRARKVFGILVVCALTFSTPGFVSSNVAKAADGHQLASMVSHYTIDNGTDYFRSSDPINVSEDGTFSIEEKVNDDGSITLSVKGNEYVEAGFYIDNIQGRTFTIGEIKSITVETGEDSDPIGVDIWVDVDDDGEYFEWENREDVELEAYTDLGNDTYFSVLSETGDHQFVVNDATEMTREDDEDTYGLDTFELIKDEFAANRAVVWVGVYPTEDGGSELSATITSVSIELETDEADAVMTDLQGHWSEKDVMKLIRSGIVSGYADGTFQPDRTITRAEFTKMLVGAAGLNPVASPQLNFADVDAIPGWARGDVAAAVQADLITGYGDNTFRPDEPITREQLAVMVVRALGDDHELDGESDEPSFADTTQIAEWAKSEVVTAVKAGIVTGMADGTFRPGQTATRAEAATMLARFIDIAGSR